MDAGIAVIVSTVFATLGWIYSGRVMRANERRKHTYNLIVRQQDDKKYAKWVKDFKSLLASGDLAVLDTSKLPPENESLDNLLNHYEFLCAAIWCGDVDEKLFKRCEKTRLISLYEKSSLYIEANRLHGRQGSLWKNLEALVGRWRGDVKPLPLQGLVERFAMRPCNPKRQ